MVSKLLNGRVITFKDSEDEGNRFDRLFSTRTCQPHTPGGRITITVAHPDGSRSTVWRDSLVELAQWLLIELELVLKSEMVEAK